ncbi:MAG TPA: helix-turn-helix transcriptional regulator [Polyangiaceae bacterium]|nr:helix-turn-helix transcriptional regulator [Polyangiaceae bacterium]
MSSDALLTTKDVALLLRVHPKQVYRLLKRGLPALRVGDEWRFERAAVLRWSGAASEVPRAPAVEGASVPPLLAANGDCAIEVVLGRLRASGAPLLGLVTADHAGAAELLAAGRVLVAGQHADGAAPDGVRWARVHLMTREVGLASRGRPRQRGVRAIVGRRLASRPPTAGVRQRLDRALERAGADRARAYRDALELDSHRDVVLAVSAGKADVGITTHAWAGVAGLSFEAIGSEAYELVVPASRLGEAPVVALCELLQSAALRRQLRERFGYGVAKTGELRFA